MSGEAFPNLSSIYEAYHGRVVAYAARLLGRDQAEDIAQEVFVKVGRSLEGLADPSRLTSWIYTITLNAVRDSIRRRRADPVSEAREPSSGQGDEEPPVAEWRDRRARTPEEIAARNEMVACYLDYVKRLRRGHYLVYALSEFEGLSNQEIAERLSLSLATVKIRLHRARATVHEALRRNCQCYYNERGELMGAPKQR